MNHQHLATTLPRGGSGRSLRRGRNLPPALALALALCAPAAPVRSQTDLAIPGAVQVTLAPAEAVGAGAGWSIGGNPPQTSGAIETGLRPGRATVRFSRIPGWIEPPSREIVVVGGRMEEISADYASQSEFYFRNLPDQTARHGTLLRFLVRSADPDDPESPPAGTALSMQAAPPPVGALVFDAASRELSYLPDPADRTDFVVTFTASTPGGPVEGSVLMSPLPDLAAEDSALHFRNEDVVPDSNDYLRVRVETGKTEEIFNQRMQKTRKVSISGAWIIFEANSTKMPVYDRFNGDPDLKELSIFADRVIIRSPLRLPQTTVRIFARELRFEATGQIDVTQTTAPFPVYADLNGVKGPDLTIQVERFYSDPTPQPRFVSRGINGRNAEGGTDGGSGVREGTEICGFEQGKTIVFEGCNNTELGEQEVYCGSKRIFGEDAVAFSPPGEGGDGGTIFSTLDLGPYADLPPGAAGAKGRDTIGGIPIGFGSKVWAGPPTNPCSSFSIGSMTGIRGRNATAPPALHPTGLPGQVQISADPGAWLHPISVQSFLLFVKDLYLASDPEPVRKHLEEYAAAIDRLKGDLPDGEELRLFNQLAAEIASLLSRLDNSLDYFGNPLTWVPMLSFEADLLAFTQEIDRAIPVLYLGYWIESAANRAKNTRAAIEAGKAKLEQEIDAALDAYEKAQAEVPTLMLEADQLTTQMTALTQKLAQLQADLLRRAQENVQERHKVPLWRKAIGTLGAITKAIPWGQPAVGFAGVGLDLISRLDANKPLEGLGRLPDLIKTVSEAEYTSCLKEKAEETKKDEGKDKSKRVSRVEACGSLATAGIKDLREIFKSTAIKDEEVKAEFDKIRAADFAFKSVTAELKALTSQKQVLVERIASAMKIITGTAARVAEMLLAIQKLDQNLDGVLEVLDHQAILHMANLEREARDRLLKYQYLMAKAYQYRVLKPYTGSFKLDDFFDELKALADFDNSSHDLSAADFAALKAIYLAELSRIGEDMLNDLNTNAPSRSAPVSFRLLPEELAQLNTTGKLSIDLGRRNLFGAAEENLRIVSLATKRSVFKVEGQVTGTATLRLEFQHSGYSRIHSGEKHYLFTHYRTERVNPITWSTVYSALTNETSETSISAADESLLRVLLGLTGASSDAVLLFSRPGALAEIEVTKEVTADNGVDIDVEDLILELVYDYSKRNSPVRDLKVEVNDGLLPLITVSQTDLNGRSDGRGLFERSYQGAGVVRLQAPARYGVWRFARWESADVRPSGGAVVLGSEPVLDVTVSADVAVRAVYDVQDETAPGSFRRGDANGDTRVDISDAVSTLGFLFTGGVQPPCQDAADTNDDGNVDISDAVTALAFLFTGGAAPPAPGPEACGSDPTADALGNCEDPAGACQ